MLTPSQYLECVNAHRDCTLYFSPGFFVEQTIKYKGVLYTIGDFNKKYPHPSVIVKIDDRANDNRPENPDQSKAWMFKLS